MENGNIIVEIVVFLAIAVLILLFVFPTKKNQIPFFYREGGKKQTLADYLEERREKDRKHIRRIK